MVPKSAAADLDAADLDGADPESIRLAMVMDSGLIVEPVIGRRFAPTRWRCAGMTALKDAGTQTMLTPPKP
jgi:hypothetical protein